MAQPEYPPPASERWNINLPAVIGVVFVFLIGVVIWVIVASGDDGTGLVSESTTTLATTTTAPETTTTTTTTTVAATVPGTTTPAPMPPPTATSGPPPATTTAPTPPPATAPPPTAAPTTVATTIATTTVAPSPPTTADGSEPDSVPGDLGIPDYPMQAPPCSDSFITIIASAVGEDVAAGLEVYLEDYPTSNYLRTDQTCPSLAQDIEGEPIYVVYFGPFPFAADACEARAEGTEGAYVRILSETQPPTYAVNCPTP